MNRDQQEAGSLTGYLSRSGRPFAGKHVMSLVDNDPVRTPLVQSHLLRFGQQGGEETRSVLHLDTNQVDDQVRSRVIQKLEDLLEGRRVILIAQREKTRHGLIVSFGIDQAGLVVPRNESFDETRYESGFPAARLAAEEYRLAFTVGADVAVVFTAKEQAMLFEIEWK